LRPESLEGIGEVLPLAARARFLEVSPHRLGVPDRRLVADSGRIENARLLVEFREAAHDRREAFPCFICQSRFFNSFCLLASDFVAVSSFESS
jgi:hypothetical protein